MDARGNVTWCQSFNNLLMALKLIIYFFSFLVVQFMQFNTVVKFHIRNLLEESNSYLKN